MSEPIYDDDSDDEGDVCVHGKSFSEICVQCCPEDDDGSFTGDEWSGAPHGDRDVKP